MMCAKARPWFTTFSSKPSFRPIEYCFARDILSMAPKGKGMAPMGPAMAKLLANQQGPHAMKRPASSEEAAIQVKVEPRSPLPAKRKQASGVEVLKKPAASPRALPGLAALPRAPLLRRRIFPLRRRLRAKQKASESISQWRQQDEYRWYSIRIDSNELRQRVHVELEKKRKTRGSGRSSGILSGCWTRASRFAGGNR